MRKEWKDFLRCSRLLVRELCAVGRSDQDRLQTVQECCGLHGVAGGSRHLAPALKNWDKLEARVDIQCTARMWEISARD